MENLPWYVYATFIATVVLSLVLFSRATYYSKFFLVVLAVVIIIQSALGLTGFYSDPATMKTRFPLLIFPFSIFLVSRFFTTGGKAFIDGLDVKALTIFHSIRILVEIVLVWLFVHNTIPQAMTFEGRNFDILSGLTAPLVYYFGFVKNRLSNTVIIVWNFICIVLLLSVVSSAVLSLPGRFEQFGFEQPNVAVGFFPFLLLPAVVVPLALFSNAATIRLLMSRT